MTQQHIRRELLLSREQIATFAERIYTEVRSEVPEYAARLDEDLDRDFAEVNRRNVEIFFRALAEDRPPSAGELELLGAAARRRRDQAVPLEAIFHSYRVGVRVMWECLLEIAPARDHGRLAGLALEYSDRVSTAAAQAYMEERQRAVQSRQDAVRLLLTRIMNGGATDEAEAADEAEALGLDLALPHAAMIATAQGGFQRTGSGSDLGLAAVQARLQEAVPAALIALLSVGLVAVVPAEAMAAAEGAAAAGCEPGGVAAGLGTPRSGPAGLAASFQEAARARALGAVLEPGRAVHRYRELQIFDLFKEAETADFVSEVLRPLLALPEAPRQRLLDSLEAIFAAALNRKLAARRLGVHQNTLGHRVRKIEALLGGSLQSGEFCFRIQLALRLLPLAEAERRRGR